MCGRFYLHAELNDILRRFNIRQMGSVSIRTGEIFPTQQIAVIVENPVRELVAMRWGWEASFLKKTLINARAETLLDKQMFRQAIHNRRCIVPASGYYEWAAAKDGKKRYEIALKDQPLIALAGIYQSQRMESGEQIDAVTIITRQAAPQIQTIHDRMPLVLGPQEQEAFLSADLPESELRELLLWEKNFEQLYALPYEEERNATDNARHE